MNSKYSTTIPNWAFVFIVGACAVSAIVTLVFNARGMVDNESLMKRMSTLEYRQQFIERDLLRFGVPAEATKRKE